MMLLWDLYWPVVLAAFIIGVFAGRRGFFRPKVEDELNKEQVGAADRIYRARRKKFLWAGFGAALAVVALWHWGGTAERFARQAQTSARAVLDQWEMQQVDARISRAPLNRGLVLSGPADTFQRTELVRIMSYSPGISRVRWQDQPVTAGFKIPLVAEAALLASFAFLLGLFLSYLVEIRRRANAEWSW